MSIRVSLKNKFTKGLTNRSSLNMNHESRVNLQVPPLEDETSAKRSLTKLDRVASNQREGRSNVVSQKTLHSNYNSGVS